MFVVVIVASMVIALVAFLLLVDHRSLRSTGRHARHDVRSNVAIHPATLRAAR